MGDEDGGGDGTDAGGRAQQRNLAGEGGFAAHRLDDRPVEGVDTPIEQCQMLVEIGGDEGVGLFGAPGALLFAHGDELIATPRQRGETGARRLDGRLDPHGQAPAQLGQHHRIDRVGLGAPAGGAGEVAGLLGIDPGMGDAPRGQRLAKDRIVATGRLHHDEAGRAGQSIDPRPHRLGGVGDAARRAFSAVVEIEMMFRDVASDNERVYCHRACPCGARSGSDAASCNCSGGSNAGGEPSRTAASSSGARGPTVSRPPPLWHISNTRGSRQAVAGVLQNHDDRTVEQVTRPVPTD